jgi:hypothetical protein
MLQAGGQPHVQEIFSTTFLAASQLVIGLICCYCDGQTGYRPMHPNTTMVHNALYGVIILYRDHLPKRSKLNRLTCCVTTDHLHIKTAAGTHINVKDG